MSAVDHGTGSARVGLLYTGGLLGPLGGSLVNAMLPELAHTFDTSVDTVGLSVSAFLFPFALMLLVSGRLADRWGPRRTLRVGYAGYAVASVLCVLAPHVSVFLSARAVQGMANALITPVLMTVLAGVAAPGRLGRTLGLFGSVQAAGQASAPALGGLAAEVDWRWAFLAVALTATLLGLAGTHTGRSPRPHRAARSDQGTRDERPPHQERPAGSRRGGHRWPLAMPSAVATSSYATFTGVLLLAALVASDRFGASPSVRGAIVAAVGVAGLASGFAVGRLVDRIGPRRCGLVAGLALGGSAALAAVAGNVALLVGAMALTGVAGTAVRASTNVLALSGPAPGGRTSGASMVLGFQFLGGALAPLLWLPLYGVADQLALVGCGSGAFLAALLLLVSARRANRRTECGSPPPGAGPHPQRAAPAAEATEDAAGPTGGSPPGPDTPGTARTPRR